MLQIEANAAHCASLNIYLIRLTDRLG